MHLLHFILLVLLGLLAPSTPAVAGQMVGMAAGNVGQDLDRTVGNDLEAGQAFSEDLLLTYELRCALGAGQDGASIWKEEGQFLDQRVLPALVQV